MSGSDLVDIFLHSIEGGTAMDEGKDGCLTMVDKEQCRKDSDI